MMRNPNGYAFVVNPRPSEWRLNSPDSQSQYVCEGITEIDTFMCGHCGMHVHIMPHQKVDDLGGFCRQCMKSICSRCLETGRCDPLEKKIIRAEERKVALKSYGVI